MEVRTNYIISNSGVRVWRSPMVHPILQKTNINHPDFLRKATEEYTRGRVRGLPKICSENSEDARTWFLFSPLIEKTENQTSTLLTLFSQAFPGEIDASILHNLQASKLYFWHGKETPTLKLERPPLLPFRQGSTEVDLIVAIENQVVVFVEAKYRSNVSTGVKYAPNWDQVIRNIDVGSWFANGHFQRFYFILLQYGNYPSNAESILLSYKDKPEVIRKALKHRTDLDDQQISLLARSIAFVRWPDPIDPFILR